MTTDTFAEMAMSCCALAARMLGWRPAEFWTSTPAELAAALRDPAALPQTASPSRELIEKLMERDAHG